MELVYDKKLFRQMSDDELFQIDGGTTLGELWNAIGIAVSIVDIGMLPAMVIATFGIPALMAAVAVGGVFGIVSLLYSIK